MAESLVEELLKKSDNKVYRFGYEAILQNLTQIDAAFDRRSEIGQRVSSIPDFLVLNKFGKPFFVEVKFRKNPEWQNTSLLENIEKFWMAKVILVTLQKPYFRITSPRYLDNNNGHFLSLEKDPDLNVATEDLESVEPLIEQYLARGRSFFRQSGVRIKSGR